MTGIRSRTGKRLAFTMIELMVVILIIAILVSLVTAGVVKVLGRIPEIQTRTEISELDVALQAFMTDYGLSEPPPSYLILNESLTYNAANPVEAASLQFLKKVFGKNLGSGLPRWPTPPNPLLPWIDWNGDGLANGPWILEGEQCLVFYTGGIPNNAQRLAGTATFDCQGFSTNNLNPATPGGKRKGPYFTFQSGRLSTLVNKVGNVFYVYLDPWQVKNPPSAPPGLVYPPPLPLGIGPPHPNGWPYAYFSCYGVNNGYSATDCASIGALPYASGLGQYTNSNRYQIISAGQNGVFGSYGNPVNLWNPSSGAVGFGADDQANFSAGLLGTGQR